MNKLKTMKDVFKHYQLTTKEAEEIVAKSLAVLYVQETISGIVDDLFSHLNNEDKFKICFIISQIQKIIKTESDGKPSGY